MTRVRTHHRLVLLLSHLINAKLERFRQCHLMSFIALTHHECTARQKLTRHATRVLEGRKLC
jgi:hypothetical protein